MGLACDLQAWIHSYECHRMGTEITSPTELEALETYCVFDEAGETPLGQVQILSSTTDAAYGIDQETGRRVVIDSPDTYLQEVTLVANADCTS